MNPIAAARAVVTNPYSAVLAVITLTLLAVSLGRLNKTKTKADYLVAGRSLPAFVLIFTLLSSWIGSGSLLGGAENVRPPREPELRPPPTRASADEAIDIRGNASDKTTAIVLTMPRARCVNFMSISSNPRQRGTALNMGTVA